MGSGQFVSKKAYEVAYAIFRVTPVVKRSSFADHLENKGLMLLAATLAEDYPGARIVSRGIEYLLQFGADVGVINQANAQGIINELKVFNSAIAELENAAGLATEVDLNAVFSKLPVPAKKEEFGNKVISQEREKLYASLGSSVGDSESSGTNVNINTGDNGSDNHNIVKSAMRQSAILERIRQNGNCRLRDMENLLPEISERTIRYDLQNLAEQGLIERMGNGGPATFYRIRA